MQRSSLPKFLCTKLQANRQRWFVTGVAGFIGSHLLENLLLLDQEVVGLDNLSSGSQSNLEDVRTIVGEKLYQNFTFVEGSILDADLCLKLTQKADYVLHQAALGSVARSINNPQLYNQVNIEGFLNVIVAARDAKVKKFVYASSSSVYGDEPNLPKRENRIGQPLSPYALTKLVDEQYASLFAQLYTVGCIGLRYFNVFGPRQNPQGEYAAVIPRWISERLNGDDCTIFGDGTTSRDFCFVSNVVQANLLAALSGNSNAAEVYNVALGDEISLNQLYATIDLAISGADKTKAANYAEFRLGDVKHSKADIGKIKNQLGFIPGINVELGLKLVVDWFRNNRGKIYES